ncbi:hypothetical protein BH23CHL5_BH23CHL5_09210 [soil metagenome]
MNPPGPITKLVGRIEELNRIQHLLRSDSARLVTLTGPGGIGKTRLALAAALSLSGSYTSGATFIDLSAIRDPSLIPGAIAAHLDARQEQGESLLDALKASIADRQLLLVIDNWEHVLDAVTIVTDLLTHCESLAVLATSRERLHLRGEWEIPLEPLPVPGVGDGSNLEHISRIPSVQLFVERAAASSPGFSVTADNALHLVKLCRALEGLPLAIELAAARAHSLTVSELLAAMTSRLDTLSDGPRDLPVRQRTIRAAIQWSYDLLDDREQSLLARLSVFAGGFSADAAAEVSVCDGEVCGDELQYDLYALTDRSLLRRDRPFGLVPRFTMTETIRDFSQELLDHFGIRDDVERAHASWFVRVAEEAEPRLMGTDPMECFHELERDLGNIRSALLWLIAQDRVEDALRLTGALAWFWTEPRYLSEDRAWYQSLLDRADDTIPAPVRAKAYVAAGDLAQWQAETEAAETFHLRGAELLEKAGEFEKMPAVLRGLGSVSLERQDLDRAIQLLRESRDLAAQTGNSWEVAASTNLLGLTDHLKGQMEEAIKSHREAVRIWEEIGDSAHVVAALVSLGLAYVWAGNCELAANQFCRALVLADEQEDRVQASICVTGAGLIALLCDENTEAAIPMFAGGEAIRDETGTPVWSGVVDRLEVHYSRARTNVGTLAFDELWNDGYQLDRTTLSERAISVLRCQRPEV